MLTIELSAAGSELPPRNLTASTKAAPAPTVAALAADPDVLERSGRVLTAGDLAREYGFTDVDGKRPEGFRLPAADG